MRTARSTPIVALLLVLSLAMMTVSCTKNDKPEQTPKPPEAGVNAGPDGHPVPFREPVRLSSKDGVLEVRLSAHQGTVNLDTVKEPVTNFLV
jgi:hypothetical protein